MSKKVTAVLVFHPTKMDGLESYGAKIASNPPLTIPGMEELLDLIPKLEEFGPFSKLYCSRLQRASGAVSFLSLHFDLDFSSKKGLGQHASKDGSEIFFYPGYEGEDFSTWQEEAVRALLEIADESRDGDIVLVVAHRPTIAGIVCYANGINNPKGIHKMANDPGFAAPGFALAQVLQSDEITIPA